MSKNLHSSAFCRWKKSQISVFPLLSSNYQQYVSDFSLESLKSIFLLSTLRQWFSINGDWTELWNQKHKALGENREN